MPFAEHKKAPEEIPGLSAFQPVVTTGIDLFWTKSRFLSGRDPAPGANECLAPRDLIVLLKGDYPLIVPLGEYPDPEANLPCSFAGLLRRRVDKCRTKEEDQPKVSTICCTIALRGGRSCVTTDHTISRSTPKYSWMTLLRRPIALRQGIWG